jgi:hypothetical protein
VSGVTAVLPVDDDGCDDADWLADDDALAFTLADDDALVLGVADVCPVGEDTAACVCTALGLVQVEPDVGWIVFWSVLFDVEPVLGLGDTVVVAVSLGLTLRAAVALGLLVLALAGGLVVLPPLWLPLDDTAGAGGFPVGLLAELGVVSAPDGLVDGDGQELCVLGAATPGMLAGEPPPAVGTGVLPWPSVTPGPLDDELLMLNAEPMASPTCTIAWRAGGMTARTTPTANTAAPTAKAGRSIASRQSVGRFGARRASPSPASPPRLVSGWSPPRTQPRRRPRPARKPEMASHTPSAPLSRLERAGRDRILSRIRSSPSAPGST